MLEEKRCVNGENFRQIEMQPILLEIKRRRWQWIGHINRNPLNSTHPSQEWHGVDPRRTKNSSATDERGWTHKRSPRQRNKEVAQNEEDRAVKMGGLFDEISEKGRERRKWREGKQ